MTFLPLPRGAEPNYAGLLTVELPAGIRKGDINDLTAHQLTTALFRLGGRQVRQLDAGTVYKGEGQDATHVIAVAPCTHTDASARTRAGVAPPIAATWKSAWSRR